jgi:uncharacterized protein (TIGR02996 family)
LVSKLPLAEAERFARAIATATDRDLAWAVFSDWLADHGADPVPALAAWRDQHGDKILSPVYEGSIIAWESCANSSCSNRRCVRVSIAKNLARNSAGVYDVRAYKTTEDAWADLVLACCKSAGIEFSE